MSEPFDPYVEWLGVTVGRQPANHYELLGVPLYENDPAIISQAADARIARLRRERPGPRMAQWQQLLDELRAAKACLTDPAAKAAYDAELTRRLLAGSANPPPAPGVTPPMPQSPQMALPPGLAPSPPTFPPPPATPSPAAPYTPPAALYVPPAAPYTPPAAPYTPPPPNMVGGPSVAPYSPNVPGQGSLANIPAAGPVPGAASDRHARGHPRRHSGAPRHNRALETRSARQSSP